MPADTSFADTSMTEQPLISVDSLSEYLFMLAKTILGADKKHVVQFKQPQLLDIIEQFILEVQGVSLFLIKLELEDFEFEFTLSNTLSEEFSAISSVVAVIKGRGQLKNDVPLDKQITVTELPSNYNSDKDTYDSLKSILSLGISPYFNAITLAQSQSQSVGTAKKKFNELILSLEHLQQTIQVPNLILTTHPQIKVFIQNGIPVDFIDSLPVELLADSNFLNSLQSIVNDWVKQVQNLTRLTHDPIDGSTSDEVTFWTSKENALKSIQEQLNSPEVQITLDILRYAKRFHATASFLSDTGINDSLSLASRYNMLLKDLPIDELLSSHNLGKVEEAILLLFNHLKKLRITQYPIDRSIQLVEVIAQDITTKIIEIIKKFNLMSIDYQEFTNAMGSINSIFNILDEQLKDFTILARETLRKRSEKFMVIKINNSDELMNRIKYLETFRFTHQEFYSTIITLTKTIKSEEIDFVKEIEYAYEAVLTVDCIDLSLEGQKQWNIAEKVYSERSTIVENGIIHLLTTVLNLTKNSSEMFTIFEKFEFLLNRTNVRSAIQEHQTELLGLIQKDITALQSQFKVQMQIQELIQLRDLPSFTSTILWVNQMNDRLNFLIYRLELVLTKEWAQYPEGKKIFNEISLFKEKLLIDKFFQDWLTEMEERIQRPISKQNILAINQTPSKELKLSVNFDVISIELFKEVKNLSLVGFEIPRNIDSYSQTIQLIYPYSMSLLESVQNLENTVSLIDNLGEFKILIAPSLTSVFESVTLLANSQWRDLLNAQDLLDSDLGHLEEVKVLETVVNLENHVIELINRYEKLFTAKEKLIKLLKQLSTADYSFAIFKASMTDIQKLINSLILDGFTDVQEFVDAINNTTQNILKSRCENKLQLLFDEFDEFDNEYNFISETVHRIVIQDLKVIVTPKIEHSVVQWVALLNECVDAVALQSSILTNDFDVKINIIHNDGDTLYQIRDEVAFSYQQCINSIELVTSQANAYLGTWLGLQSLWDLDIEEVQSSLGDDLQQWLDILDDMRQSRETFDTIETSKKIGPLILDYEQAQSRVNSHYDNWQKQMAVRFSQVLSTEMKETSVFLTNSRKQLENTLVDFSSADSTMNLISVVLRLKQSLKSCQHSLKLFEHGQRTLTRARFRLPQDWLHHEQIQADYLSLVELIDKRSNVISSQMDVVSSRLEAESSRLQQLTEISKKKWQDCKPIGKHIVSSTALSSLNTFDANFSKLQEDISKLINAGTLLNLRVTLDADLSDLLEEINDLKAVWSSIDTLSSSYSDVISLKWEDVAARSIRKTLEDLLTRSRSMPIRVRQYSAFEEIQDVLKSAIKAIPTLSGLKSDAVTNRHWNDIFKRLTLSNAPEELTLKNVLDLNLASNEKYLKSIIQKAQGEKSIEDSINTIEENWGQVSFQLFQYNDKYKLIKGWDLLFQKTTEDLNSLSSIKLSPYYAFFEKKASQLEETLSFVYSLLDTWVDVQRQWIYLSGVFDKNEEIKRLLPVESTRFENLTSEFFSLLKSVYKSMLVIDIVNIPSLQPTLEKMSETLNKVRKSLMGYLEKQREILPRFYFIGNEDLLEIIGNSKNINMISKHLKKMFSGINNLIYESESLLIKGVISPENEEVILTNSVSLIKRPSLNDWLPALESELRLTLASLLEASLSELESYWQSDTLELNFFNWLLKYPNQVLILSIQVLWTKLLESSLSRKDSINTVLVKYSLVLKTLASIVLKDLDYLSRRKLENMIIEVLHQRDTLDILVQKGTTSLCSYAWKSQQRYYFDGSKTNSIKSVTVKQGNSSFSYGFEYIGAPPRLVYTPLVNNSFIGMTEALNQRLGGSLVGPAGTGKTESVKALGQNLGMMVLVFCCDETFDLHAVSRILVGICRVGAWCCFDEFNRLDEKMLSAVSTQIEKIENALGSETPIEIDLLGKKLEVNQDSGIFITSNPEYAGRSALPDNLKSKYRTMAVVKPDTTIIAEVLLTSQGFENAKDLARKIVPLFSDLSYNCSNQPHYDFGLRALKSTLVTCGSIKRRFFEIDPAELLKVESQIIVNSLYNVVLPKLIPEDEAVFDNSIKAFEIAHNLFESSDMLVKQLKNVATEYGIDPSETWLRKALQVFEIQQSHHGFMMVGRAGCGKSTLFDCLIKAMYKESGIENICFRIDPKVLGKDALYGSLDYATRDWTDGVFTSIVRKVDGNLRGEKSKRVWIIFDGDVDPNWVENLNSVLDDNKLLTLPNGERISLPDNLKIVFEVDNLNHATPATVSRCGIVWFGDFLVDYQKLYQKMIFDFRQSKMDSEDAINEEIVSTGFNVQGIRDKVTDLIQTVLPLHLVDKLFSSSESYDRAMGAHYHSSLSMLFTILKSRFAVLILFMQHNVTFIFEDFSAFIGKHIMIAIVWSLTGDSSLIQRELLSSELMRDPQFEKYEDGHSGSLLYVDVSLPEFSWVPYALKVPAITLEPHMVTQPDVIIPTTDTVVHEDMIYLLLNQHRTVILCGPPGSGKTMTLIAALRKNSDFMLVGLNFSKETSPKLLLNTLEQHCTYKKTANGVVLSPSVRGKWMVVFCDEINLPALDEFESQTAISFLRQLIEQGGFWSTTGGHWVSLSNIQFVGACNPPSDPGRNVLSSRFLRHCSVITVNYPGKESLMQIYETFNTAALRCVPDLREYSNALTNSMIQVYDRSRMKFTTQEKAHYIYSPRELTRWVKGIFEAIRTFTSLSVEGLIRLWAHEALRLFSDRLTDRIDRNWTFSLIKDTADEFFPHTDLSGALKQPILYSDWLDYEYSPVEENQLANFVSERLRVFSEEETDVSLVLYKDLLDHILRIDRVLKNPQGHLILVGPSSSGKTILTKFVAWINGLKVFQLNVTRKYSLSDFDKTLRDLLRRSGAEGEKICFVIDESSILESAFLERMNTLLANAEIPGLFEGEDFSSLMNLCAQQSQLQGLYLDSNDELYQWFTDQISQNFHVVFTINDPYLPDVPQIISSPALFNRCVISWMGDWSEATLTSVSRDLLNSLPIDKSEFEVPKSLVRSIPEEVQFYRDAVIDAIVSIHLAVKNLDIRSKFTSTAGPGEFLTFVKNFSHIFADNEKEILEYQSHVNIGLDKLRETFLNVRKLNEKLSVKKNELREKDREAREMLDQMITDQNEAERKQEASLEIQKLLATQEKKINQRRDVVLNDLAEVEPLILEAQKGVKNIKKQHLTEMRSMQNPPEAIKMTLESVCILLGYEVSSWRDVQLIIRKDDFIANIVNYDSEVQLTREIAEFMESEYLSRPTYNYESVNRASKACGPLVLWAQAQLRYAAIVERIDPLRREVNMLENGLIETKNKLIAIDGMITDLQDNIELYKRNYSDTIRETEKIKNEMHDVELKVSRSSELLESLADERTRWSDTVGAFKDRREYLIGNTLLNAAFVTYAGPFDQKVRYQIEQSWNSKLESSGIYFDKGLRLVENITNSGQILSWQQNGLPNDDLFLENTAIMTSSTDRFSYIIDPSGLVIDFLVKETLPKQLVVASFLDNGFLKQLENCIRFGGSILIQDGEYFDPIISRVISREIEIAGGRNLVKLGDKEIDLSPEFKLYIHSKDTSTHIQPFVSSRMNVLNFSFTTASLVSQALNMTLKSEKPEVEEQRLELFKINGEYKERLRGLEAELLTSMSDSKVSILENDDLSNKLKLIKSESKAIKDKVKESSSIIEKVNSIMEMYKPLAVCYSKIHILLDKLHSLNSVYHFASDYLTNILANTLKLAKGRNIDEMMLTFTHEVFATTTTSLLQKDRSIFGLLLFLVSKSDSNLDAGALISTLKDNPHSTAFIEKLITEDDSNLNGLISDYTDLLDDIGLESSFHRMHVYDFEHIVGHHNIMLLRSTAGFDAGARVQTLARSLAKKVVSYSMGSHEGLEVAKRLVIESSKKGNWLIIENIQMSTEFLDQAPKLYESLTKHSDFKLFFTCQIDSNVPIALSKLCKQVIFETSPGVKTIMNDCLITHNATLSLNEARGPTELKKVYFLLSWFYSLLKEQLRFVPISYHKRYEFNENDLISSKYIIDQVIEEVANGESNISPESIPWDVISNMVGGIAFGGKVDNSKDLEMITGISMKLFNVNAFEFDFNILLTGNHKLSIPESCKIEDYVDWVNKLPELEPVEWLGLDSNVYKIINKDERNRVAESTAYLFEETMVSL